MPGMVGHVRLGVPVAGARAICVFVHGRNQSPEGMAADVIRHLTVPGVDHILPRSGDACWYRALAVDPLTDATRAELGQSLADLGALIAALRGEAPGVPLLLAGFSQGACLSVEHAMAGGDADAVVALTGCRVGVEGDARPDALRPGLPVYLTAGQDDPWISLTAFAAACVALGRGGARLRADVFPGRPHRMAPAEIAMLDAILADLTQGRAPRMEAPR
jgi:phospholipase/carboxylesterase